METVEGYIFLSSTGEFLGSMLFWLELARPEEAYVHTIKPAEIKRQAEAGNWKIKPTHYIPATWDGTEVKIKGRKRAIQ